MTKHANKHATSRHTVVPPDALIHSIFTHLLGATTQTDTQAAPSSSAAKSALQANREQILSLIHSYVADRHTHLPIHTVQLLVSTALTTAADTQFAVQVLDTVCTHTYQQAGNRVGEVTDRLRVCAQLFDAVVDRCLRQQQYEEAVSVIDLRNKHMSLPHASISTGTNIGTNMQTHNEHTDTYTEPRFVHAIPRRFAAEFRACVFGDKLSRALAIAHTVACEQAPEHVFVSEVVYTLVNMLLTSPNRHTHAHTTQQHTLRVYDVVNLCANIARWHQYADRGREIVLQQVLPRVMDTIHTHSMNTHGQVDTQLQMIRTLFTPPSIQTDTTPTSQTTDAHSRHLDGLVQLLTSILNNKHTDTDITTYKDSAVMPYVLSVIDEQREPQMSVHYVLLAASHLAHTQLMKTSNAAQTLFAQDTLKQPLPMSALVGTDKYSKPPATARNVPTSRPNRDSLKRRKFDKKAIQYDEEGECDDKEIMGRRIALSLSTVASASSSTGADTQVSRRIIDAIGDLIMQHANHLASHYYSKNKVSNTSIARNNVQTQHRHPDVDSSVHPNNDVVASALLNNAVAIIWNRFQQQQHQAANNDVHTQGEAILAQAAALEAASEHMVKLLTTSLSMRGTLDTKLLPDVINAIVATVSTSTSTVRPVATDPMKFAPTFDKTAISLCGHVAQLLWLHNHANSRAFSEHPVLVQTVEHVAKMLASYVDGASNNPNTDQACLMGAMSVLMDLEATTPLAVIPHAQSQ
jgi:translation initiation factor 2 beta subunit (eIF-2beta)/eIF-5